MAKKEKPIEICLFGRGKGVNYGQRAIHKSNDAV